MIKLLFGTSLWVTGLAHTHRHSVAGITLPPADANTHFFIETLGLPGA
jgi:hypothetical protein